MKIRKATMEDLNQIVVIASLCFPSNEAASKKTLRERLEVYPDYFWLLKEDGKLIGFIDGLVLTCEDKFIHYFKKFGFKNEGVSESTYRGKVCYLMRLEF